MFKRALLLSLMLLPVLPALAGDGLRRTSPEAQGVPSETIDRFFRSVDESGLEVHSVMILRNDAVIAEHWWAPYAPEDAHAMYSATKTFTAMAVGFAVQEGLLSVSDKVTKFFPDLLPAEISPDLAALTVEHLLTMSAGHETTRYPGSGKEQMRSFLATGFKHHPGEVFEYDITCSHMLSHIIRRVTGMTIKEYMTPRFFEPLGISDIVWEMDEDGVNMGNGGMHLRTADMAKLGIFLRNKGAWNGKQLLNPAWIEEATSAHIYQKIPGRPEPDAKGDGGQGYGYQIWLGRNGSYRAIGGMCQLVMVIPDKQLVVAAHCALREEDRFNDMIYAMLPSFSDRKLKEKKTTAAPEWSSLALPKPFVAGEAGLKDCVRRFRMHQNPYGIERVYLRFDHSGNCFLTIDSGSSLEEIPFGISDWKKGRSGRKMVFGRSAYPGIMGTSPYTTAGMCSWTAPDTLRTHYITMFNPGIYEDFEFRFADGGVQMVILPVNPAHPGNPGRAVAPVVLSGTEFSTR